MPPPDQRKGPPDAEIGPQINKNTSADQQIGPQAVNYHRRPVKMGRVDVLWAVTTLEEVRNSGADFLAAPLRSGNPHLVILGFVNPVY